MIIEKSGVKLFRSAVRRCIQKAGVKKVITQASVFDGLSTALAHPKPVKTAHPRFCTKEMKQARAMNKMVIRQTKTGTGSYSKATFLPRNKKKKVP